jgi:hypothetical protein
VGENEPKCAAARAMLAYNHVKHDTNILLLYIGTISYMFDGKPSVHTQKVTQLLQMFFDHMLMMNCLMTRLQPLLLP